MKKLLSISLFVSVIVFSCTVYAQPIWEIKQHSTTIEALEDEVTEYMNNGYVPFGITYDSVELYLLYVYTPDFGAGAWSINWYDSWDEVENGITDMGNQNYIPTGITHTGEQFYVLYVQVENSATAWRLESSAVDLQSVHDAIQPYVSQGYVPIGITAFEGEYWTLLLKIPNTTIKSWLLESYVVGNHADGINANVDEGYLPWGIMYRDDMVDILYVGF